MLCMVSTALALPSLSHWGLYWFFGDRICRKVTDFVERYGVIKLFIFHNGMSGNT